MVVGAATLLAGLVLAGRMLRERLQSSDRYQVQFRHIECPVPAGVDRDQFLGEVRYYGEFPEVLSLLDESLPDKLRAAFARHAWVERVERIEIQPGSRVVVRLEYRVPVLAVVYGGREPAVRAVDRYGILLPRTVNTLALPHVTTPTPPAGPSGQPWGQPLVHDTAKVAALLLPLAIKVKEVLWDDGMIRLTLEDSVIMIWGKTPGSEAPGESAAPIKLQRLLERARTAKPNERIDLRFE